MEQLMEMRSLGLIVRLWYSSSHSSNEGAPMIFIFSCLNYYISLMGGDTTRETNLNVNLKSKIRGNKPMITILIPVLTGTWQIPRLRLESGSLSRQKLKFLSRSPARGRWWVLPSWCSYQGSSTKPCLWKLWRFYFKRHEEKSRSYDRTEGYQGDTAGRIGQSGADTFYWSFIEATVPLLISKK